MCYGAVNPVSVCIHEFCLLIRGTCLSCCVFQVYWVGRMSAGVVAALLYNFLLTPRDERFGGKARVLFCSDLSTAKEIQEPFLENLENEKWSKRLGEA